MPVPASLEERPPIVIPTTDLRSLREIVTATRPSDPRAAVAAWLAEELDRAAVVAPEVLPPRVVTMHAQVSYRDDVTDQVGRMTLVYPGEEDAEGQAISVLSSVGAALVGLSEGQSIRWRTPSGGLRGLTVLRVLFQPYGRLGASDGGPRARP
ncbi:nucleoside diphosphate kinase regulator [Methylobacterium sp. 092160098-2]|uniref:nucleoside diphosphate kinase regulator n=1 Tax=Methylobacterium sp. 092160098-2 TaxID=3025129 RepID=UPI0023819E10|nr:nucleoside diphosphate kinase regulator [Methylobacterium sp. 092160098-2]MDE4914603.1 nucleoside diphosphate kinase regulator [Methylobacterium sp. 092160098-2]